MTSGIAGPAAWSRSRIIATTNTTEKSADVPTRESQHLGPPRRLRQPIRPFQQPQPGTQHQGNGRGVQRRAQPREERGAPIEVVSAPADDEQRRVDEREVLRSAAHSPAHLPAQELLDDRDAPVHEGHQQQFSYQEVERHDPERAGRRHRGERELPEALEDEPGGHPGVVDDERRRQERDRVRHTAEARPDEQRHRHERRRQGEDEAEYHRAEATAGGSSSRRRIGGHGRRLRPRGRAVSGIAARVSARERPPGGSLPL